MELFWSILAIEPKKDLPVYSRGALRQSVWVLFGFNETDLNFNSAFTSSS
jgi:hypothetical protein